MLRLRKLENGSVEIKVAITKVTNADTVEQATTMLAETITKGLADVTADIGEYDQVAIDNQGDKVCRKKKEEAE